jgi:hypothetical protein
MGLDPAIHYLEGMATPEPRFPHLLNLKSRRRQPLFVTNQVTSFSLPPATCLTDFSILAYRATIARAVWFFSTTVEYERRL